MVVMMTMMVVVVMMMKIICSQGLIPEYCEINLTPVFSKSLDYKNSFETSYVLNVK